MTSMYSPGRSPLAGKHHDFVRIRPARAVRSDFLLGPSTRIRSTIPTSAARFASRDRVLERGDLVHPPPLLLFRNVVGHLPGLRVLPRGILERVRSVKPDLPHQCDGLPVILLRLRRKTGDDVRREADARDPPPDLLHQVEVVVRPYTSGSSAPEFGPSRTGPADGRYLQMLSVDAIVSISRSDMSCGWDVVNRMRTAGPRPRRSASGPRSRSSRPGTSSRSVPSSVTSRKPCAARSATSRTMPASGRLRSLPPRERDHAERAELVASPHHRQPGADPVGAQRDDVVVVLDPREADRDPLLPFERPLHEVRELPVFVGPDDDVDERSSSTSRVRSRSAMHPRMPDHQRRILLLEGRDESRAGRRSAVPRCRGWRRCSGGQHPRRPVSPVSAYPSRSECPRPPPCRPRSSGSRRSRCIPVLGLGGYGIWVMQKCGGQSTLT